MNDLKYLIPLLVLMAGCSGKPVEVLDEAGISGARHWFLFEPEPGVRCVSIKRGFGSSVDCWKTTAQPKQETE